jgi:putative tricarboxylic transport membrane protein
MTEQARDRGGMAFCAGFIAIGALALYYTKDMTALGAVFPRTVASAMMLFSIGYLLRQWWRPAAPVQRHDRGSWARRLLLVAVMFAWAVLLDRLGFLSTSIVGFFILLAVANYDRWTRQRIVGYMFASLIILFGLYSVFHFGLQVPMPYGVFF